MLTAHALTTERAHLFGLPVIGTTQGFAVDGYHLLDLASLFSSFKSVRSIKAVYLTMTFINESIL